MNRRGFLKAGGAAAAAAAASAVALWRLWPEQGVWNPCLGPLPARLSEHALVQSAWQGLDAAAVWDAHAHLAGTGSSEDGLSLRPDGEALRHPFEYAQKLFFLNAGCALGSQPGAESPYVERMRRLMQEMKPGAKVLLFAFDRAFGEKGEVLRDKTSFHVPDAYAGDVAKRHPDIFEWVASIHPYRRDCVEALDAARRSGARAVKWLPSAMGIDPASPLCDRFYAALAAAGLPLVSHAGLERAVSGSDEQSWGNPLRLRRALDAGVRVVVAHCASMGEDIDLDKGAGGPGVASFDLFARMMAEPRHVGRLFGDIAALTQTHRAVPYLVRVLERTDWDGRLLNGTDYPLPGLMPLFSVESLVSLGVLDAAAAPVLSEIRRYNPMLFDFVAKRSLRTRSGRRFPAATFETRVFFGGVTRTAK